MGSCVRHWDPGWPKVVLPLLYCPGTSQAAALPPATVHLWVPSVSHPVPYLPRLSGLPARTPSSLFAQTSSFSFPHNQEEA